MGAAGPRAGAASPSCALRPHAEQGAAAGDVGTAQQPAGKPAGRQGT